MYSRAQVSKVVLFHTADVIQYAVRHAYLTLDGKPHSCTAFLNKESTVEDLLLSDAHMNTIRRLNPSIPP
jgi:hypothetical protein